MRSEDVRQNQVNRSPGEGPRDEGPNTGRLCEGDRDTRVKQRIRQVEQRQPTKL